MRNNPKNHAESRANFCSREKEEKAQRERERVKHILLRIPLKRIRAENKGKMTTMRLFNA